MGTVPARALVAAAVAPVVLTLVACSGGKDGGGSSQPTATTTTTAAAPAAADFSAKVDHPLFSLVAVRSQTFEGTEKDPKTGEVTKTRMEKRVLDQTETVGGVEVTALEVKEYEGDELVERTLDYFAQHRDGSVWYFGERIDDYEGGKVKGHEGQWLAGVGNARPGLYLPANPVVGQEFAQEQAPGVAEDRSTILAVGAELTTPAGTFTGCIRVKDFAPLSKSEEFKFYCPKVGIVREEEPNGTSDLVRYS
jgi:hypothetical protein